MKLNDISVSRLHSLISYDQGNFFLSDNNSKFGTLILKEDFELECNKEICIQIGKTVLNIHVKNPNLKIKIPKRLTLFYFTNIHIYKWIGAIIGK